MPRTDTHNETVKDEAFKNLPIKPYQLLFSMDDIPEEERPGLRKRAEEILAFFLPSQKDSKKEFTLDMIMAHLYTGKPITESVQTDLSLYNRGLNSKSDLRDQYFPLGKLRKGHIEELFDKAETRSDDVKTRLEGIFGADNAEMTLRLPLQSIDNTTLEKEIQRFIRWYNKEISWGQPVTWSAQDPKKTYLERSDEKIVNGPKLMKLLRAHDWYLFEHIESLGGLDRTSLKEKRQFDRAEKKPFNLAHIQNTLIKKRLYNVQYLGDHDGLLSDGDISDYHIVISANPVLIGEMSTGQAWRSCMNLYDGTYKNRVLDDIEHGSIVAYLVHKDDKNCRHPLLRRTLKPGFRDDDFLENHAAYFPDNLYGFSSDSEVTMSFGRSLHEYLSGNINQGLTGDFEVKEEVYRDGVTSFTLNKHAADNDKTVQDYERQFEQEDNWNGNIVFFDFLQSHINAPRSDLEAFCEHFNFYARIHSNIAHEKQFFFYHNSKGSDYFKKQIPFLDDIKQGKNLESAIKDNLEKDLLETDLGQLEACLTLLSDHYPQADQGIEAFLNNDDSSSFHRYHLSTLSRLYYRLTENNDNEALEFPLSGHAFARLLERLEIFLSSSEARHAMPIMSGIIKGANYKRYYYTSHEYQTTFNQTLNALCLQFFSDDFLARYNLKKEPNFPKKYADFIVKTARLENQNDPTSTERNLEAASIIADYFGFSARDKRYYETLIELSGNTGPDGVAKAFCTVIFDSYTQCATEEDQHAYLESLIEPFETLKKQMPETDVPRILVAKYLCVLTDISEDKKAYGALKSYLENKADILEKVEQGLEKIQSVKTVEEFSKRAFLSFYKGNKKAQPETLRNALLRASEQISNSIHLYRQGTFPNQSLMRGKLTPLRRSRFVFH